MRCWSVSRLFIGCVGIIVRIFFVVCDDIVRNGVRWVGYVKCYYILGLGKDLLFFILECIVWLSVLMNCV